MESAAISLLDLPGKLLLAIVGNLNIIDVLVGLTTAHPRLDPECLFQTSA